jgi:hypothetical protein
MNKELTWRIFKALYTLYTNGKIPSTGGKNSQVKYLLTRKLIRYQYGNRNYLEKADGYDDYFSKNFLQDFLLYEDFLCSIDIKPDGRKTYTIRDIRTLMFIAENKNELKKALTTRRTFSSEVFKYGGSKYLENSKSLHDAVCKILEIQNFPSEDPKTHQWRFVVDCPNPKIIVLCENLDFLKTPSIAREHNIELWYVGGNNTSNVAHISQEKLNKPLFYSCDWDYHGLKIYCRLKDIFKEKSIELKLLYPSNLQHRLPVNSPNHNSAWSPSIDFSGLEKSYFSKKEIPLIYQLIEKNQWIEEESNDLLDMIQTNLSN